MSLYEFNKQMYFHLSHSINVFPAFVCDCVCLGAGCEEKIVAVNNFIHESVIQLTCKSQLNNRLMNDQKKIQAGEAWAQEHRLRRIQTRMFEAFGNMDRAMDFFDKVGLSLVYFQGEREHRKGEWERNALVFIGGWTDFPFPPSLFAFGC
jgi:hypothetical protein